MEKHQSIRQIYSFYKSNQQSEEYQHIKKSVSIISDCILESKFENFYVSFNGGKDATIVLFLTFFAMAELEVKQTIPCLYFSEPKPFPETEEFIQMMEERIKLNVIQLPTKNYPSELKTLQEQKGLDWIVMGSRKDDPYCSTLGAIAESDTNKGYPKFKRINPIIDWDYDTVWKFIIAFKIPYCKLYDEGYTYLGNKGNTVKNKHLYDAEKHEYKKAYEAENQMETISRKQISSKEEQPQESKKEEQL